MGHGRDNGRWFAMAHELAETGLYKNVAEVEAALKSKEPQAVLPENKIARGLIDVACFHVRRAKGWDT